MHPLTIRRGRPDDAGVAPLSAERLQAIAQDSPWDTPEELDAFLADVHAARLRD